MRFPVKTNSSTLRYFRFIGWWRRIPCTFNIITIFVTHSVCGCTPRKDNECPNYSEVIMSAMASKFTDVSIVCSSVFFFQAQIKKTSKLHVTGLYEGNPSVTGGFPSQRASNAENVSIWSRHHVEWITLISTALLGQGLSKSIMLWLHQRQWLRFYFDCCRFWFDLHVD